MDNNRVKTALVLGANGFVGFGIAMGLSRAGFKVYGVIRQETYAQQLAQQEILPIVGDFEETSWTEKLGPIDVIVNASQSKKDVDIWVENLLKLVTKIAKKQTKKPLFIFTSGIYVYGDTGRTNEPDFHSVDEETPYNPLPSAAFRIKTVERLLASEDFYTSVVLPGMIYGRGQSYYGIYIKQAETSDKIVAHTPPETVWHGVHIDDVADAYARIANLGEKAHGKKYNVAGDKYETIDEILKALVKHFGNKHEIVYVDPENKEAYLGLRVSIWVNSDKIRRELGWAPRKASFTDGIEEYVSAWRAYQTGK
jgi:nucleoside-diphosphate-sugar epimerase